MNQIVQIPCGSCKEPMGVEINQPDLYNSATSSVMVLTHEHPVACPKCFARFTLVVGGVQGFMFGLAPFVEPSKIVAPNGFKAK